MANSSHAALGVWYKPRQCFCHAQHLRLIRLDSAVGISVDYPGTRERETYCNSFRNLKVSTPDLPASKTADGRGILSELFRLNVQRTDARGERTVPFPTQIDYSDYRDVGGVKCPSNGQECGPMASRRPSCPKFKSMFLSRRRSSRGPLLRLRPRSSVAQTRGFGEE